MRGLMLAASFVMATSVLVAETAQERLADSARVFSEVMRTPDKGIPQNLLAKAQCVVIIPGMKKAAFVVGAEYGRGFAECRHEDGKGWGAPAAVRMEGGSVGFQIGGQATDFVILVMNNRGADSVLHSKVKLGGDASIAAGPKGRDASADTDVTMRAEMLSYSRARGVFAGVSLEGSTLRADNDANRRIYGKEVSAEDIITESRLQAPASAHHLLSRLEKASPHRREKQ